jgi:hypothetical protein
LEPIAHLNLIRTGETVFHIPTYNAYHRSDAGYRPVNCPLYGADGSYSKAVLLKYLHEMSPTLDVEMFEEIMKSYDIGERVYDAIEMVLGHIPAVESVHGLERALGEIGDVLGIAGAILSALEGLLNIAEANSPKRMPIAAATTAYATASWMFWGEYKNAPDPPQTILKGPVTLDGTTDITARKAILAIWTNVWQRTINVLEDIPVARKGKLQMAFGGTPDNAYKKIVLGFESQKEDVFYGILGEAAVLSKMETSMLDSFYDQGFLMGSYSASKISIVR